jgi:hypothetical protein
MIIRMPYPRIRDQNSEQYETLAIAMACNLLHYAAVIHQRHSLLPALIKNY